MTGDQPFVPASREIGTGLIVCGMVAAALKFRLSGPALVGLALYFAGGASNLVDRVMRGSVIDFLNVGVGPLRTGIFNVADMAILLGVGIFVFTKSGRLTPNPCGFLLYVAPCISVT